jgi:Holliday junction resolvasome RuvABC ATP-dependent DNA helicase subunit
MQIGLLERTPRGRKVTRKAYEHLGKPVDLQEKTV